ncbi:unnamed protein product [Neospora caninum Liverpool]|uniref:AP2 domain transcription factor AP2VIII-2 n=1 Tax=Neospora caninum (strain Liverpool) TaxID=572307 RepID=F0VIE4_NEOCL|nr:uncharacterized protein NCLIV_032930 [Neospora caninum Liverpool]CBZ53505.1 unnamed protein product [Neospora caninum Liverpool]CEL67493.1 TPA: AP2 domain transcription factor AP2VIII-2 [Neospora caninum Liverpool]|eukprot:XP_003883537.1 uncharacterized protein NCLIV_032930 [Neospora caninum Liverpool]
MEVPTSSPSSPVAQASTQPKCESSSPRLAAVKAEPGCQSDPPGPASENVGPPVSTVPTQTAPPGDASRSERRSLTEGAALPEAAAPPAETVGAPEGEAGAPETSPQDGLDAPSSPHGRASVRSTLNVARSTCLSILNALSLCCPEWKKKDNFRSFYFHFAQISQAADRSFLDIYLTIVFDKIIRSLPPQPCPPPIPLVVKAIREIPQNDVNDITAELDALRLSSAAAAAQAAATSGACIDFEPSLSLSALAEARPSQSHSGFSPKGKKGEDTGLVSPRKTARASPTGDSQGTTAPSHPRGGRGGVRGGLGRGGSGAARTQRGGMAHAGADEEGFPDEFAEEAGAPESASPATGAAGPAGGSTPQALRRLVGGISFNRSGNAWVASWVTRTDFKHRYKYFKTADFGYEQARLLAIRFRQHKLLSGDAVVEASELQQRLPHGLGVGAAAAHYAPGASAEGDGADEAFANDESEKGEDGMEAAAGVSSAHRPARSPPKGVLDVAGAGGLGLSTAHDRGFEARPRGGANFRATEPSPMEGVYYREGGNGGTGSASWQCRWSVGGKKYSKTFAVSKYGPDKARELAIRFRLQQSEAMLGTQGQENYTNRSLEMVISEGDQNPVIFDRDASAHAEVPHAAAGPAPGGPAHRSPAQVALSWSDSGGPDECEGTFSDGHFARKPGASGDGFGRRAGGGGVASNALSPQGFPAGAHGLSPGVPSSCGEETPSQSGTGERGGAWQAGVKFDEATNAWKAWWRHNGGRAVFKAYPIARYGEAVAREKAETAMRAKALELQVMGGDVPRTGASAEGREAARLYSARSRGRGASPYGQAFAGGSGGHQAGATASGISPAEGRGPAAIYYARRPEEEGAGASSPSSRRASPGAGGHAGAASAASLASFLSRGAGGVLLPGEADLEEHDLKGILDLDKRVPGSVFLQQSAYCLSFGGGGKWVASWGVGGSDRLLSRSFSVSRFGFAQARAMAEHWRRTKLLKLWRTEQERKETASREALMMVAAGSSRLGKDRSGGAAASSLSGKKGDMHLGLLPPHRHTPYSHSPSLAGKRGSGAAAGSGAVGTTSSALHHFLKLSQGRATGGAEAWAPGKGGGGRGAGKGDLSPTSRLASSLEAGSMCGAGEASGASPGDRGNGSQSLSQYPLGLRDEGEEGAEEGLASSCEGDGVSRLLPPSRVSGAGAAGGVLAKREKDNEERRPHPLLQDDELSPHASGASSFDVVFDAQAQAWNVEMLSLRGEKVVKSFSAVALGGVEAARRSALAAQRGMEAELVREYLDADKGTVHLGVSFDRRHLAWRLQPAVVVEAVLKKLRTETEETEKGSAGEPVGDVPEVKAEEGDGFAAREKKPPRLTGQLAAPEKIAAIASRPVAMFTVNALGWERSRAAALKASHDLQLELGVAEASLPPLEDVFEHPDLSRLLMAHLRKTTRNRQVSSPGGSLDLGDGHRLRTPSLSPSPHLSPGLGDAGSPALGSRPRRGWSPSGSGARRPVGASPGAFEDDESSREAEQACAAAMKVAAAQGVRCLQVSDFLADVEISTMDAQAAAQRRAALAANAAAAAEAIAAEYAACGAPGEDGADRKDDAGGKRGDVASLTTSKGIHYSKRERAWVCRWTDAVTGKVAVKAFQEKKFGFDEARRLAEIYRRAAEATGRVKIREGPATSTGLPLVRFVQTRGADKARGGVWRVEWLVSEPEAEADSDGAQDGKAVQAGWKPSRRAGVTLQVLKPFLCHQFGVETGRLLALHLKKKLDGVYGPLAEKLRRRHAAANAQGPGSQKGETGPETAAERPAGDRSDAAGEKPGEEGQPAEAAGGVSPPGGLPAGDHTQRAPSAVSTSFFFDPSDLEFEDICSQFQAVQKILRETAELEARVHHALLTNAPLPFIMEPPPSPPSIFASGECGLLAGALGSGRDGEGPMVSLEALALAAASGRGGRGSRGGRLSTGSGGSLGHEEGRRRRKRDPTADATGAPGADGDGSVKRESDEEGGKRRRRLATPGSGRRGGRESAAARLAAVAADLISTTAAAQASLVADKLQSQKDGDLGRLAARDGARGPGRGVPGARGLEERRGAQREDSSSDSSSDSSDSDSSNSSDSSSSSDSLSSGEDTASVGRPSEPRKPDTGTPLLPSCLSSETPASPAAPVPASPREGLGKPGAAAASGAQARRGGPQRRPRQGPGGDDRGARGGRSGAGRGETMQAPPEAVTAQGGRAPRGAPGSPPGGAAPFRAPASRGRTPELLAQGKDGAGPPASPAQSPAAGQQADAALPPSGLLQQGVVGVSSGGPHAPLLNPAAASALNLVLQQRRAQGSSALSPSSHQAMTALVASALAAAASRGGVPGPVAGAAAGPSAGAPASSVGLSSSPLLARLAQNPQQQACLAAAAAAFQRQQELQRQIQQRALFSASRLPPRVGAVGREGEAEPAPASGAAPAGLLSASSPSLSPGLSAASASETLSAFRAKQALAHFQQQIRQGLQLQHGVEAQGLRAPQGTAGHVPAVSAVRGPADPASGPEAGEREDGPAASLAAGRGRLTAAAGVAPGALGGPGGERLPFLVSANLENRQHLQRLQQEHLLAAAAAASTARSAGGAVGLPAGGAVGLPAGGAVSGTESSGVFFGGASRPTAPHCLPGGPAALGPGGATGPPAAAHHQGQQSLRFQQQVAAVQQQQQRLPQQRQ